MLSNERKPADKTNKRKAKEINGIIGQMMEIDDAEGEKEEAPDKDGGDNDHGWR